MISIIITAYREEKTIGRAIQSFSSIRNKEILVVAPDKATLNEAKRYKVKVIKDSGRGKPAALNLALEKAEGNILILTDADVYTENSSALLNHFKNKSIGAVTGRPISLNSRSNILGYWSHLLTDIGAHATRAERSSKGKFIVCSGYLYAMRNIIKEIPQNLLSEDAYISHLIRSKGYKIAYEPRAKAFVKYPTNFNDWLKQKIRSTGGYLQMNKYFKGPRMRSFVKESMGVFRIFSYPRNIKELYFTALLIFARIYLWVLVVLKIRILKKSFKEVWKRVESTK